MTESVGFDSDGTRFETASWKGGGQDELRFKLGKGWCFMSRRFRFGVGAMLMFAATTQAQVRGNTPKDFFNISPQVGWTSASGGGLFGGVFVSEYKYVTEPIYVGIGAGAYLQGNEAVGEALLKGSFAGIYGASAGPTVSETGRVNLTNDFWVNAMLIGLRWRMVHRQDETIHDVALFAPLGLLMHR